jgi:hypothetical protein
LGGGAPNKGPKTKFKAMTMDEQVETIENTAQESIRIREEIRAVKAVEAWKRGTLLLEIPSRITPTDTNQGGRTECLKNSSTRRDCHPRKH